MVGPRKRNDYQITTYKNQCKCYRNWEKQNAANKIVYLLKIITFLEKLENRQYNYVKPLEWCLYANNATILVMPIHLWQYFNQVVEIETVLQDNHVFIDLAEYGNHQIEHQHLI